MDVLISRSGDPYIEGSNVLVNFIATGRQGADTLQVAFRVQYAWGATTTQRDNAIKAAANQAKTDYETAHGITLPAVNRLEILL